MRYVHFFFIIHLKKLFFEIGSNFEVLSLLVTLIIIIMMSNMKKTKILAKYIQIKILFNKNYICNQ